MKHLFVPYELALLAKQKDKMFNNQVFLQDDTYKDDGVLNMDKTWNQL